MKKILLLLFLFLSINKISAQWDLSASMGLDFKSSPSFRDYVNTGFSYGNDLIPTFKSAINFTGEAAYKLSNTFALGLEYGLQIDSYTASAGPGGIYEISYTMQKPSIVAYYVIPGNGYQLKLGGGAGLRFASLTEKIYNSADYSVNGYGFLLKAEGNTILSRYFYALIGANIRYDVTGDVSNGQNTLINRATGEVLNLNAISFGIYLGISFIL